MPELAQGENRLVVMLTSDQQIDRRITLQADSLEASGWRVVIIGMPLDSGHDHDARVVRISNDAGKAQLENLVLDAYRWIRGCLPMNGPVMRFLKRIAWKHIVDQESFFTGLYLASALRYSPRVFVAHDLPMLPVAVKAARVRCARLVYDSHELYSEQEFSDHERRKWTNIEARYICACDVVITVNPSIAVELKRRHALSDVHIIYNADRASQIQGKSCLFHEVFGLSIDKKILLMQGGLSAGRNLEVLLGAMRYVQNSSVVLVVLGDGVLTKRLKKLVLQQGLLGRVYFHDAVPQSSLMEFTAAADAGVIPYQATCLNNLYCTPNKLFEFIASGLPILATDLPEIRKIVVEQEIGMVGETGSSISLADMIDDFFSDEQQFEKWKTNVNLLRKIVCWEQEEQKLVKIYETLR